MKRERMPAPWRSVVDEVGSRCAAAGLDLVQPFQAAWYNCAVDDVFRLPDFGRSSALGVLIGNTRAIWPRFLAALRADARALDESHPLDTYVRAAVLGALEPLVHRWEARFSFEPPPRRIAMQRLAHVSGFAYLSPSHLSVHATAAAESVSRLRESLPAEVPSRGLRDGCHVGGARRDRAVLAALACSPRRLPRGALPSVQR